MKALLLSIWAICMCLMVSGSAFSDDENKVQPSPAKPVPAIEIEDKGFIYINKIENKIKVRDVGASNPSQKSPVVPQETTRPKMQVTPTTDDLDEEIDQTISELSNNKDQLAQLEGIKSMESGGDHISSFMKKMQGTMMTKLLKENPLKLLPKDQMRSTFLSMIEGTPYKKIMENNPKLMNFAMEWLVDDNAIKGFLNIPSNQKRMKNYLYILIGFFIFGFFLNHYLTRDSGLLKKIIVKLFMMVFTIGGNLTIFYFMFKKELDPTLDLVKKHFL
jgi:hypothetical protein